MKLIVAVRSQAVTASLLGFSDRLLKKLQDVLTRLSVELQAHVKEDKLSGQVLNVVTGTLRRSINREVRMPSPGLIEAVVGTNVEYARVHEYGFRGQQSVKAHLRTIKQAWGKPIQARQVAVAAHTRTVNFPERSFLRSALRDLQDKARASIQRAAVEAARP